MPRFQFSPSAVTANFSVLPKGHYTLTIGEGKPFINPEKDGKQSYGVRFGIKVLSPSDASKLKPAPINCYQHNEGSQSVAKAFLIAAYGFHNNSDGEAQFNQATAGADWGYDTDTGEIGDGWAAIVGKAIDCDADIAIYDGNQQNKLRFSPTKVA